MKTLDRLQLIFNSIGDEDDLVLKESELVIVRHAGWIRRVWNANKNDIESLGAYPVYDSEPGSALLRDIHLPFVMSYSEEEALSILKQRVMQAKCSFDIDDCLSKSRENKVTPTEERIVLSLYTTFALIARRQQYWIKNNALLKPEAAIVCWQSSLRYMQHEKPQNLTYLQLLNFFVQWLPLFYADANIRNRQLPRIGCFNKDTGQSISIGFSLINKGFVE